MVLPTKAESMSPFTATPLLESSCLRGTFCGTLLLCVCVRLVLTNHVQMLQTRPRCAVAEVRPFDSELPLVES